MISSVTGAATALSDKRHGGRLKNAGRAAIAHGVGGFVGSLISGLTFINPLGGMISGNINSRLYAKLQGREATEKEIEIAAFSGIAGGGIDYYTGTLPIGSSIGSSFFGIICETYVEMGKDIEKFIKDAIKGNTEVIDESNNDRKKSNP